MHWTNPRLARKIQNCFTSRRRAELPYLLCIPRWCQRWGARWDPFHAVLSHGIKFTKPNTAWTLPVGDTWHPKTEQFLVSMMRWIMLQLKRAWQHWILDRIKFMSSRHWRPFFTLGISHSAKRTPMGWLVRRSALLHVTSITSFELITETYSVINTISELLGVDARKLALCLTQRVSVIRNESTVSPLSKSQVCTIVPP